MAGIMGSSMSMPSASSNVLDMLNASSKVAAQTASKGMTNAKAKAQSQDFEAVFLNSMFKEMFTDVGGDGPVGGSGAVGVWRSFLTDEYAKSFSKAGGIGIADQVYRSLMAQQEVHQ